MESIFNLTSLNGLEGLKHFFGNTFLIKQGKSYVLVGDDNLNRAEFGKFSKRPEFTSMGNVIYAGLQRIRLLTNASYNDFGVRLHQSNPIAGIVSIEIIQGRTSQREPSDSVPAIWIQYNLKSPKYVKFSLLLYRLACSNGMMVHYDDFIQEKIPVGQINHIHHQWMPCYYHKMLSAYERTNKELKRIGIDRNKMSDQLIRTFRLGTKPRELDRQLFANQEDDSLMQLDRISSYYIEKDGEAAFALVQIATHFATHISPELFNHLSPIQQQQLIDKYREKRLNQAGRLMKSLELKLRKYTEYTDMNYRWEDMKY